MYEESQLELILLYIIQDFFLRSSLLTRKSGSDASNVFESVWRQPVSYFSYVFALFPLSLMLSHHIFSC